MKAIKTLLKFAFYTWLTVTISGCPSGPSGCGEGGVFPEPTQVDAHLCSCQCQYPSGQSVQFYLPVCFPAGVTEMTDAQRNQDCMERLQTTLNHLNVACNYPPCECTSAGSGMNGAFYSGGSCRTDAGTPVNDGCSNFDPQIDVVDATNVEGDPPIWTPFSPLSATIFGRRTSCSVSGTTHVAVAGQDPQDSQTSGIVNFVGEPCPGQSCATRMEYQMDFGSVTFGNFIHSETLSDLAGIGHNPTGNNFTISANGDGTIGAGTMVNAGRGRRNGGTLNGIQTTNPTDVNINVGWAESVPSCRINGNVTGSGTPDVGVCENAGPSAGQLCSSDSDCTNDPACSDGVCNCETVSQVQVSLGLDLNGTIVNQPPTADAGPKQTIECSTAAATNVVLDGSASHDPDSNIVIYRWFADSRVGSTVGTSEVTNITQALGSKKYVLRVIDAVGQAHDSTTEVDVVDTTPPVVNCAVSTSQLGVTTQINHNLVNVGLTGTAVDQCEGARPVDVSVFSDEDDNAVGDGNQSPDAKDIAVGTLRLRAERQGTGDGRVYLIVSSAADTSGNRGFACCTVTVPVSNKAASLTLVQNQATAATNYCRSHGGTAPTGYFVVGDGPIIGSKQ